MLRVCLIEACDDKDCGSIGANYIRQHAIKAGYSVDVLRSPSDGYDIELISIHHCTNFETLKNMRRTKAVRLVGGHPMQNNPRPIIRYADAVFIGEGELIIADSLNAVERKGIDGLKEIPGWIISKDWDSGDSVPTAIQCDSIPDNEPYLNYEGTRSAAWYIELARGCPFSCAYCELGNSVKHRFINLARAKSLIDKCDMKKCKKINFFAPDEASVPHYNEILEYANSRGYSSLFSSMRVDSVLRKKINVAKNVLIRVGIDGLTEQTRFRLNKKISNKMILEYFLKLIREGHVNFKIFMVFGYSWESVTDFEEFRDLILSISRMPFNKNIHLRIKFTPFIPQPCTPLKDDNAKYDYEMIEKIKSFFDEFRNPSSSPGLYVRNDGLMSERSWANQVKLTCGTEDVLK